MEGETMEPALMPPLDAETEMEACRLAVIHADSWGLNVGAC